MSGAYDLKLENNEYKKVYQKSSFSGNCAFCREKLDGRRTNMEHFDGSCIRIKKEKCEKQ
jgi:hypothetical protein